MTEGNKIIALVVRGVAERRTGNVEIPDYYHVFLKLEDGTLDFYDEHTRRANAVIQAEGMADRIGWDNPEGTPLDVEYPDEILIVED